MPPQETHKQARKMYALNVTKIWLFSFNIQSIYMKRSINDLNILFTILLKIPLEVADIGKNKIISS